MKSSGEPIGEAAARFGLDTHVLRYWEDEGLLRPARDGAGRRLFAEDDVVRVAVILRNKAAGMSLDDHTSSDQAKRRKRITAGQTPSLSG